MVITGSNQKIKNETGWFPIVELETAMQDILIDWKERLKV
jgi:nucleoside-diphosphate-sugar epimerase